VFYDDARNKYTGYCFSCAAKGLEAYVENPYEGGAKVNPPKKKTEAEIREEIEEIRQLKPPTFTYRGIPKEYFKRSGVKLAYSEYDGETPNSFNFPFSLKGDLIGYKTILIDKKVMWSVGNIKGADLYNWEVAKKKGTKRLYITEGEWDCHALEYMLEKASGGKYKYAVTSLPHGAGSAASVIGRMRKEIETIFDEIVLVFKKFRKLYLTFL
jgi:twinkle protein